MVAPIPTLGPTAGRRSFLPCNDVVRRRPRRFTHGRPSPSPARHDSSRQRALNAGSPGQSMAVARDRVARRHSRSSSTTDSAGRQGLPTRGTKLSVPSRSSRPHLSELGHPEVPTDTSGPFANRSTGKVERGRGPSRSARDPHRAPRSPNRSTIQPFQADSADRDVGSLGGKSPPNPHCTGVP